MEFEEQYEDVLHSIESGIISVYRENPDISDYDVTRAIEVLIDDYSGEKIGRPPRNVRLSDVEKNIVDEMRKSCEWQMGREEIKDADEESAEIEPVTIDEIILCLRRILKSVNYWNKSGGRQGYLSYMSHFVW